MCTESKLIKTTLDGKKVKQRFNIMPGSSVGPKLFMNEKKKLFGPEQKKIVQKI